MTPALRSLILAAVLPLAACGGVGETVVPTDLPPMGEFRLGHNIAVAKTVERVPISREVTQAQLETAMKAAIQERFGSYEGRKLYHIGVNIDAYLLAPPGVPVVASPKSLLVVTANVWDDSKGVKLGEPRQFTIWENLTGSTAIGSGLTQSAEQQLENLARNAAKEIHGWMLDHPEWFEVDADDIARLDALSAAAARQSAQEARRYGTRISPNPPPRARPPAIAVRAAVPAAPVVPPAPPAMERER